MQCIFNFFYNFERSLLLAHLCDCAGMDPEHSEGERGSSVVRFIAGESNGATGGGRASFLTLDSK